MPIVKSGEARIHYALEVQGGTPALVFSNSLGANYSMWGPQAAEFRKRFRVLRYDTRGWLRIRPFILRRKYLRSRTVPDDLISVIAPMGCKSLLPQLILPFFDQVKSVGLHIVEHLPLAAWPLYLDAFRPRRFA